MIFKRGLTGVLSGVVMACTATLAGAAEPLVIHSDQSKIIELPRAPGIVVVGNPSIADATIQGRRVFLHGRSFGNTNVIVLDEDGRQLVDFEVDVQLGGQNNVALFKAGQQFSYVCATDCESVMHTGDFPDYFKEWVVKQNQERINLATGQRSAEANEPPPAQ